MIAPDFEYRLYDGAPAGNSVLSLAMAYVDTFLAGLKLNSRSPLKPQLQAFFGDTLSQFGVDLETLDPGLRFERIEAPLVSGGYAVGPINYKLRLSISGDWELAFPISTFDAWPDTQPLDPQANQFKLRVNLAKLALLSFGIRVEYWDPLAAFPHGDWRLLTTVPVLDGSSVSGVHAKTAITLSVGPGQYELVPESGQKFRPVKPVVTSVDLSNDHTDINLGPVPFSWLPDALNYLAQHAFGLDIYQAIAHKLLQDAKDKIEAKLTPDALPKTLDFPSVAVYGKAFNRPPSEWTTFVSFPEIDIVGGPANTRAIDFRNAPPVSHPVDPGDLFNPDILIPVGDRLINSLNLNQFLADIFNIHIPTPLPAYNTGTLTREAINAAVANAGQIPSRARDLSVLHLLEDGVPAAALGTLRWDQIDLAKRSLRTGVDQLARTYSFRSDSERALTQWKQASAAIRRQRDVGEADFVFVSPQGVPLGVRGVLSLAFSYRQLVGPWGDLGRIPWHSGADAPPLPTTTSEFMAALGYAVNIVVPDVQFGFLFAAGGFNLMQYAVPTTDFTAVYPSLATSASFSIRTTSPSAAPLVNFATNANPALPLIGLHVELQTPGTGQTPLLATVSVDVGLKPVALSAPDCMFGKENLFLALVENLACLSEAGLISFTENPAQLLQALLHRYSIALVPDGTVTVQSVSADSAGTFPIGPLDALLTAALPRVFATMIPVPVLFDLFHIVPATNRDLDHQKIFASGHWLTLIQPLKP